MIDCPEGDYPKMPCVPAEEDHREKNIKVARIMNAMVSRPVGGAGMLTNAKAMESMKKEWKGLIDQGVFDLSVIREYYDVVREVRNIPNFRRKTHEENTRVVGWCLGTRRRTRHCFKIWGILLQLSKLPDGLTFWVALTDGMCKWLMQHRRISRPHCGVHLVGSSFQLKQFLRMIKNDGISSTDPWFAL